jgi:hypothetical protein
MIWRHLSSWSEGFEVWEQVSSVAVVYIGEGALQRLVPYGTSRYSAKVAIC